MPNLKAVPEATWRRLAALEPRCSFSFWRDDEWLVTGPGGRMVWSGIGGPPSRHRRTWRARIVQRSLPVSSAYIDTSEPHLADALLAAVEEAERRGWHRVTVRVEDGSPPAPDAPAIDRRATEDRARATHLRGLSAGSHGIDGGSDPSRGRYRDVAE